MQTWYPAYVGVGSNLNDPRAQVLAAFERLERVPDTRLIARSKLYRSRPLGPVAQPDFVNAAAGLLTRLEPVALLAALRAIESVLGRPAQHERWGPRIIDLDLLCYACERRTDAALTLPHPGITARNFVLYPLSDIAPELDLPGLGRVAALKESVGSEGISELPARG